MRVQLVLACLALCVASAMAFPRRGRIGGLRKDSSEESAEREGGVRSICRLTNLTSALTQEAACKEGYACTAQLQFLIRADTFSAAFCVEEEEEEEATTPATTDPALEPLEEAEPLPEEKDALIDFLLRRACSVVNETSGAEEETRGCPRGLTCSLGAVGVEDDEGDFLTATYCQADGQDEDWMRVLNGRRRRGGSSSEESEESEESESSEESEESSEEKGGRRKGFLARFMGRRRGRRDVRGPRVGACNITDASGVEMASLACAEGSACAVGPVEADDNGTPINIYFCEKPESSSEESSEEEEDESSEEEEDEDEVLEHLARKLFCNVCALTINGTDAEVRMTCPEDAACDAGPVSVSVGATEVVGTFCSGQASGQPFSLIDALQCQGKKGGKGGKKGGKSGKKGGKSSKGGRRGGRRG